MKSPRVTVVITVFNGARYLRATLESLAAQRFKDFEVLCGDDASSDDSASIVEEIARRDERFRLIRMPTNLGTSPRVMRQLLPHVRGQYMAYSSQDDLYSPDWVEKAMERAACLDADGVVPDTQFFTEGAAPGRSLIGVAGDRSRVLSGRAAAELSLDWSISGFVFWKTELVNRVGYSDFTMNADEYTTRRLFLAARTIAFCDGTFFYRQDNPDAITKKLSVGSFDLPVTHFHTWLLAKDAGFDDHSADAELLRCVSSLLYYARRLSGSTTLSKTQRRDAQARLDRAQTLLRSDPARARLSRLLPRVDLPTRMKILVVLSPSFIRDSIATRTSLTPAGTTT